MSRIRQFSIVFHNVKHDSKLSVENYFTALSPTKLLVAMEPYPQEEGFHIHVFVSFGNPRSFKSVLASCESFSKKIVSPRPEGEERSWGRVQVDQMRGTFEQATAYLTVPQKKKEVDPQLTSLDPELQERIDKFEWATKSMNKIYHFLQYGEKLMVREFIEREKKKGNVLDPHYQNILDIYSAGRPA